MSFSGMPKFFTNAEYNLLVNCGRELIEDTIYQYFTLYRIDIQNTKSNFYGESKSKNYLQPIILSGLIDIIDKDLILQGGMRRVSQGDITIGIYSALLNEKQVEINVGDIIFYQSKYYEVFDAGYDLDSNEKKLGVDRDFFRQILASTVKNDIFEEQV